MSVVSKQCAHSTTSLLGRGYATGGAGAPKVEMGDTSGGTPLLGSAYTYARAEWQRLQLRNKQTHSENIFRTLHSFVIAITVSKSCIELRLNWMKSSRIGDVRAQTRMTSACIA